MTYLTIRWSPGDQLWLVLDGEDVVATFPSLLEAERYVMEQDDEP